MTKTEIGPGAARAPGAAAPPQTLTPSPAAIVDGVQRGIADGQRAAQTILRVFNGSVDYGTPLLGERDVKPPITLRNQDGTAIVLAPDETQPQRVSVSFWNNKTESFVRGSLNIATGAFESLNGSQRGRAISEDRSMHLVSEALRSSSLRPEKSTPLPPLGTDPSSGAVPSGTTPQIYPQVVAVPREICASVQNRICPPVKPSEVEDGIKALGAPIRSNPGVPLRTALQELIAQGRLVPPPAEAGQVLHDLSRAAGSSFNLLTVDSPYPAAFSLGHGDIVITTRFASYLEKNYPDPSVRKQVWADVLSHEITHDELDHRQAFDGIRELHRNGGGDGRSSFVRQLVEAAVQRGYELEADKGGAQLSRRAGFTPLTPKNFAGLLTGLREVQRGLPQGIDPQFERVFGSSQPEPPSLEPHPTPQQRAVHRQNALD